MCRPNVLLAAPHKYMMTMIDLSMPWLSVVGHGVKFLFYLDALKWWCLVLNEKLVLVQRYLATVWCEFSTFSSRLERSGRPDGAVRTSRGSTSHPAQAPWGHREERWIESITHISLSHVTHTVIIAFSTCIDSHINSVQVLRTLHSTETSLLEED